VKADLEASFAKYKGLELLCGLAWPKISWKLNVKMVHNGIGVFHECNWTSEIYDLNERSPWAYRMLNCQRSLFHFGNSGRLNLFGGASRAVDFCPKGSLTDGDLVGI